MQVRRRRIPAARVRSARPVRRISAPPASGRHRTKLGRLHASQRRPRWLARESRHHPAAAGRGAGRAAGCGRARTRGDARDADQGGAARRRLRRQPEPMLPERPDDDPQGDRCDQPARVRPAPHPAGADPRTVHEPPTGGSAHRGCGHERRRSGGGAARLHAHHPVRSHDPVLGPRRLRAPAGADVGRVRRRGLPDLLPPVRVPEATSPTTCTRRARGTGFAASGSIRRRPGSTRRRTSTGTS